MYRYTTIVLCIALFAIQPASILQAQDDNMLYLYFPTADDNTFPEYGTAYGIQTSPLADFDVADLDATISTTTQLRNRITEIVKEDYREFRVRIVQATANPNPTDARWQIVGIGSDSEPSGGGYVFGVAQAVDIGDADAQDYARVYAASFLDAYGGTGGALEGTNSTLERWARAIGHTTSHEAGHNYGLGHGDAEPRPGSAEDQATNHVMATASTGLTGEIRASRRRHFSDTGYEILAHNIGLHIKTLHNWDFVNPNDVDAHSLVMTILSTASSLTISWYYKGVLCPWTNPTISSTGGTQVFQGATYNEFELVFSTAKNWSGGNPGVVPPGVMVHFGTTFSQPTAVIVYDTKLRDINGNDLPLHPRMIGYDAGSADLSTGDFAMAFFNTRPQDGVLIVRDLRIFQTPRLASIETMVADDTLTDLRGLPVELRQLPKQYEPMVEYEVADRVNLRLARLTDPRHVDITYDSTGCTRGHRPPGGSGDVSVGEIEYCPHGTALSLFPATAIYVMATVVDPHARYFDTEAGAFVTGPLESHVFYQFAGFVPDFNNNGTDDLLDIRNGTSVDKNANGVPDEAEGPPPPPWWIIILILIIIIIIIIIIWIRRRGA